MSELDKELNKKFGKSNKKLHSAYKALDLDENNSTLHGHDVVSGKGYWDAINSKKRFSKHIDESGHILEHDEANPDLVQASDSPYSRFVSDDTKAQFDALIERMKFLNRIEKEIIQLLWEGKTEKEVGIILSMSRTAVSVHLMRARNKIKRL